MIGRPEKDEAAEFCWTYIDKVQGNDVLAVLLDQLTKFGELLEELAEERSVAMLRASGAFASR